MFISIFFGTIAITVIIIYVYMSKITIIASIYEKHLFFKSSVPEIFISYKSEDSNIVRKVAESLMSLGYSVWIDQYRIPIEEQLSSKPKFTKYLKSGIDSSKKAIVFTNNRYTNSPWCLFEIKRIIDRYPQSSIFEVQIPNDLSIRKKFKDDQVILNKLNKLPSIEYIPAQHDSTFPQRLMRKLSFYSIMHKYDHRKPNKYKNKSSNESYLKINHANISFNTSGWKAKRPRPIKMVNTTLIFGQWLYFKKIDNVRFQLHIIVQHTSEQKRPRKISEEYIDDRIIMADNLKRAAYHSEVYTEQAGLTCDLVGIHLVSLLGLSHFAITYYMTNKKYFLLYPRYIRKYILTFFGHGTSKDVDIILTVTANNNRNIGDLSSFFSYMPIFDEFVDSAIFG